MVRSESVPVPAVVSDLCATGDHDCEQVCLSSPGSYTCACHQGFTLNSDGKTCNGQWTRLGKPWGGQEGGSLGFSPGDPAGLPALCLWTGLQSRQVFGVCRESSPDSSPVFYHSGFSVVERVT